MTKLLFASIMMLASFFGLSQVNMNPGNQEADSDMAALVAQGNMQDNQQNAEASVHTKALVYWSYLAQLNQSGKGSAVSDIYEDLFAKSVKDRCSSDMKRNVETFEKSFPQYVQPAREYGHNVLGINF